MSKKTFTIIIILILAALGGSYYWFFVKNSVPAVNTYTGNSQNGSTIFGGRTVSQTGSNTTSQASSQAASINNNAPIPVLRELSSTPVGGMTASTTASSTIVRWIDRGVGRVYQAYSDSDTVDELSDTIIPEVYATYWNNNATSFLLQSLNDTSSDITTFYATLYPTTVPAAASTSPVDTLATSSPYELRGSPLPSDTIALAVSPSGNQVLTLEGGDINSNSNGYISQFNGSKKTQIFTTPLNDINVEWPASNTIAITTKASTKSSGFLYFLNLKANNGIFNKIIGGVRGLTTLTSKDASEVLYTAAVDNGIKSSVYDVKTGSSQDLPFDTMPEKCVWSNLQKNILYCAVPSSIPPGNYPDDWYQGNVSFSDSIWEIDAVTGDAHIIADLLKTSGTVIDATNLTLDPKENYLYFINKQDLSLWSLEVNN